MAHKHLFREKYIAHSFLRMSISFELDAVRQYVNFSSTALVKEQKTFALRVEKEKEKYSAEESQEYLDWLADDWQNLHEEFPKILWSSAYVTAFNLFEIKMNEVCNGIKKPPGISLDLKDISGQGIERAKTYISKVIGITTPFSKEPWSRCISHSKVRNLLVHVGGETNSDMGNHKHAVSFCQSEPGINVKETSILDDYTHYEIRLSKDAVLKAIDDYHEVLMSICLQPNPDAEDNP